MHATLAHHHGEASDMFSLNIFDVLQPLLFCTAFVAAIGLGWRAWYLYSEGRKTLAWTQTTGTIISASVEQFSELDSDNHSRTYYFPKIAYAYRIAGRDYDGTNVRLNNSIMANSRAWADATVAKYPPGEMVIVFYDPANASRAVLEHHIDLRMAATLAGFALLALLIGTQLFLPYVKSLLR